METQMTEEKTIAHLIDPPLDNPPTVVTKKEATVKSPIPENEEKALVDDMALGRDTLRSMIEKGEQAVTTIAEVADQTGHPRVYEVMGTLMKNVAETIESLMHIHRVRIELILPDAPGKGSTTIENAVFVGSTKDLQNLIKQNTERVIDADVTYDSDTDASTKQE